MFLLLACNGPEVTYQAEVRPLVDEHCAACHTDGGVATTALDQPEVALAIGPSIVDEVLSRRMPPWGQDPDCRPSNGDLRLSEDELAVFQAWADADFPAGDEADYVPGTPWEIEELPDPDVVMTMPSYTPSDASSDDYRCIPLGDPLSEDLLLRGLAVIPDQVAEVHHVILYAVAPSGQEDMEPLSALDEAPGWECFGDAGLDDAQTVGGWAPGDDDQLLPPDLAKRVPAGSQFVVQMHYNLDAVDTPTEDATQVRMWLSEGEPDWIVGAFPVADTQLEILPGQETVEVGINRIPVDAVILGTSPHMHRLGRSLTTEVVRADGSRECLSKIDAYDFDWQRDYRFDEADQVSLSIEDHIEITCTFDNSEGSETVTWGDGTQDEMCLDYLALLVPYYGAGEDGVCAGVTSCAQDCDPADPYCTISCMTAAGESCMKCGLEQLFEPCIRDQCSVAPIAACLLPCAEGEEQYVDCMYSDCREEFTEYWACAEPLLSECAGEVCPGL